MTVQMDEGPVNLSSNTSLSDNGKDKGGNDSSNGNLT
jgi:hypothetical protein